MKNKIIIPLLSLMLCACTFLFATPVYALDKPDVLIQQSESAVPDNSVLSENSRPLTPDGTGTVVDNVTDGDGKEFFTIVTEDGNYFYIIIDRQRTSDNVYLLNAVTETDLMALAEKNGKKTGSAILSQNTSTAQSTDTTPASQEIEPSSSSSANSGGMNNESIIFVAIAALVVGVAGYYFKIVRPKKQAADEDEDEYEDEKSENNYDDEYPDEDDYE